MATSPLAQPDIRSAMIARLLQQGTDTSPVQHWTQGAARVAQALLGGYQMGEHEREGREAPLETFKIWQQGQQPQQHPLGPVTSGPRPQAPDMPAPRVSEAFSAFAGSPQEPRGAGQPNPMGQYGSAISSIESGGRYDAMGPVTRNGDRAHGKYQVMGANIGPWSQAALGRQVTPQEFLASPEIQDKIFQHQFGQYANKYGPEGAARAWFAGEGGMNDMGRKDQLGTTVGQYGQRFASAAGLGQQPSMPQGQPPQAAPQQMAQAPNAAMIQQMLNHPNAKVRAMGAQIMQQEMARQPKDQVVGDQLVRIGPDGRVQPLYDATKKTDDERNLASENKSRAERGLPPLSMTDFKAANSAATERGQQQGAAAASLPQAEERVSRALQGIQEIRNHPGRLHGVSSNVAGLAQGTPYYDFKVRVDQLKGGAFLEAFQMLKGGGAVTEAEGNKASIAMERMDRALSKKDFDASLKDYEDAVRAGFAKLKLKASGEARIGGQQGGVASSDNSDPLGIRR